MSRKSKGLNAERELIHMFWENGWAAIRVAGSGSSKYPSTDIIAGNILRKVAIECKAIKDKKKYFKRDEIEQLKEFATRFGAEPWIGIRFDRERWYFVMLEDLKETKEGYSVNIDMLQNKGLLFEEFIGNKQ